MADTVKSKGILHDLADQVVEKPATKAKAQPVKTEAKKTRPTQEITPGCTINISLSMLPEEREQLEDLEHAMRKAGHRRMKKSMLMRIGLKWLLEAQQEQILKMSEEVPYLEGLRVQR